MAEDLEYESRRRRRLPDWAWAVAFFGVIGSVLAAGVYFAVRLLAWKTLGGP
jgi:hypothetical protein